MVIYIAHLSDVPAMVEQFSGMGGAVSDLQRLCLPDLQSVFAVFFLLAGFASRLITIPLIINFCVAYLTASREVLLGVFSDPDAFVSDAAFLFTYRVSDRV